MLDGTERAELGFLGANAAPSASVMVANRYFVIAFSQIRRSGGRSLADDYDRLCILQS